MCVASMPLSPLERGGPGAYTSPKLQARVLDAFWYVFWDIMCSWSSRATVGTHWIKCTTYAYYRAATLSLHLSLLSGLISALVFVHHSQSMLDMSSCVCSAVSVTLELIIAPRFDGVIW